MLWKITHYQSIVSYSEICLIWSIKKITLCHIKETSLADHNINVIYIHSFWEYLKRLLLVFFPECSMYLQQITTVVFFQVWKVHVCHSGMFSVFCLCMSNVAGHFTMQQQITTKNITFNSSIPQYVSILSKSEKWGLSFSNFMLDSFVMFGVKQLSYW